MALAIRDENIGSHLEEHSIVRARHANLQGNYSRQSRMSMVQRLGCTKAIQTFIVHFGHNAPDHHISKRAHATCL